MAGKFKSGDTVMLNAGGPVMSVVGYSTAVGVRCTWFAGKKQETGTFHEASLVPAKPGAKKGAKEDDDE